MAACIKMEMKVHKPSDKTSFYHVLVTTLDFSQYLGLLNH